MDFLYTHYECTQLNIFWCMLINSNNEIDEKDSLPMDFTAYIMQHINFS